MKAMLSEINKNVQGTKSDRREAGIQINGVDQKEERNIRPEQNEETRIQKNEERLRNLQDIFKCSSNWIIGVPEGEEEEQETENLFENTKESPEDYQLISQKKLYGQEGAGKKYLKSWKTRTYIQDYCIQQSYHLEWKGR